MTELLGPTSDEFSVEKRPVWRVMVQVKAIDSHKPIFIISTAILSAIVVAAREFHPITIRAWIPGTPRLAWQSGLRFSNRTEKRRNLGGSWRVSLPRGRVAAFILVDAVEPVRVATEIVVDDDHRPCGITRLTNFGKLFAGRVDIRVIEHCSLIRSDDVVELVLPEP
jgi:hypothetical protein